MGYMAEHLDTPKPYRIIAGMDFDTVDSFILDLFKLGYMAISGKEKSGKTNFVRYFINCFETDVTEMPAEAYIYDGYDRQLSALKQSPITQKYAVSLDGIESTMTSIEVECQKRKELIAASGISAVEKLPAQLVVIQHPVFFEPDGITKACAELFKKVIKAAREAKTFIIFSNVENIPVAYGAPELLKMIKDKNNILYFDDLKSCKLAEISLAESKKHKKVTEVGDAFFITERSINRIKTPLFHPTKVSSGQPVV
jgi:S-DNA-T family DNA segregation ATPase FtsK/SpoIIIE